MNDVFSQGRIFNLLLALPAFVAAFTLHEFAHAWMANRLGDDTPRRLGRLTLDPLAHLDPVGSLMFVITQLSGYGLGWAKPVPCNPRNFQHPRRGMMLVAVAGPVSNLLQVPFWMLALGVARMVSERNGLLPPPWLDTANPYAPAQIVITVLGMGVIVNILLAAFNMIPLPPLDGHYILEGLGPPFIADWFQSVRPYSFMLLLLISFTGILAKFITPALIFAYVLTNLVAGGHFQ